ncbi:MAG: HAMP domain-containing sensor histidine kinase [Pseudomonadota bacterium]
MAQDVLLILPAFAVATAVFVRLGKAPLKKPTEIDETQDINQSLQSDWLKNFWIEPLIHANIGVLASVLLGTGTLANRLALWLALFFILTSMIQLALWSFLRAKGWGYNMWWQIALISLPYLHWARLPLLMEHGVEAVGGGIGVWTIALLTTAVLSARVLLPTITVLIITAISVTLAFFFHQHADGWFEQSTIALIVGSFSLIIAFAARGIYGEGTENRLALAQALRGEQQARRQLAHETDRRQKVIRAVGHDLRQPLSALQIWLFTARRHLKEELIDINAASASVTAAHELLESISQLSWLNDAEKEPRLAAVDLADLMENLTAEVRTLTQDAGIDMRCRPLPLMVETDAYLLKRILRNFIINAIKHGGEGKVLLGARRRGNHVDIFVADQGEGIAEEAQARIFNEFERSADDASVEGIGVGLAVARDLASAMNLKINHWSRLGKGSIFSLRVPISTAKLSS